jgi:hypothetical protein
MENMDIVERHTKLAMTIGAPPDFNASVMNTEKSCKGANESPPSDQDAPD